MLLSCYASCLLLGISCRVTLCDCSGGSWFVAELGLSRLWFHSIRVHSNIVTQRKLLCIMFVSGVLLLLLL